jgi:uncharacterized protein (TIGR02611 family)
MSSFGDPARTSPSAGPGDQEDESAFDRMVDAAVEAEFITGERESSEEEAKRHILVRLGVILAGTFVTFAGVLMLVLPGPGIVVVIAGLGILSTEVTWAERLLAYAKEKARVEEVTAQRPWVKPVSIAITTVAVLVSCTYAFLQWGAD